MWAALQIQDKRMMSLHSVLQTFFENSLTIIHFKERDRSQDKLVITLFLRAVVSRPGNNRNTRILYLQGGPKVPIHCNSGQCIEYRKMG